MSSAERQLEAVTARRSRRAALTRAAAARRVGSVAWYALRRLLWSIPVVFVATLLLFWAVRATFDPLGKLRQMQDPEAVLREIERLGLDRSVVEQYFIWLWQFLQGDWGISSRTGGDVTQLIVSALGPTLQLVAWGVVLASLTALAIGAYSATKRYSFGDHAFTTVSYIGISLPAFWFGLLLIQFLSVWPTRSFGLREPPLYSIGLGDPSDPWNYVRHLVLPVLTLTITLVASWSRFARTAMVEVLSSDYIRTAKAKGVPRGKVVVRHALRNSLAPFVTVVALDAGLLIGGLVVTEQIYSVPGMGKLFIDSLLAGDVFVLVPWMTLVAVAVIACNLFADISYAILDPRVRLGS